MSTALCLSFQREASGFSNRLFSVTLHRVFQASTSAGVREKKRQSPKFGPCLCQFPLRGNTIRSCQLQKFFRTRFAKVRSIFSYYGSHSVLQSIDVEMQLKFIRSSPGSILQFVNAVSSVASLSIIT